METESRAIIDTTDYVVFPNHDEEGSSEGQREMQPLTRSDKLLIFLLCLAQGTTCMGYACLQVFFPEVGAKKGLSLLEVGFVFSSYYIGSLFFSPFAGLLITRVGTKRVMVTSLLLTAIALISFAFTDFFYSADLFFATTVGLRVLLGFGVVGVQTSTFTIVAHKFESRIGIVTGLLEMCLGIGYSASSSLGGILYQFGGYGTPFYVLFSITFIVTILCWKFVPANNYHEDVETPWKESLGLLKLPNMYFAVIPALIYFMQQTFSTSYFSSVFKYQANLADSYIGLLAAMSAIFYAFVTYPTGLVIDRKGLVRTVSSFGFFFRGLGLIICIPDVIIGSKSTLTYGIVGISISAIAAVPAYIPIYKYFQLQVSLAGRKMDFHTSALIATLLMATQSLGSAIGPALFSEVMNIGGISLAYVSIGFLTMSMVFVFALDWLILRCKKVAKDSNPSSIEEIDSSDIVVITESSPLVINSDP